MGCRRPRSAWHRVGIRYANRDTCSRAPHRRNDADWRRQLRRPAETFSVAVTADGSAWSWGDRSYGYLADGSDMSGDTAAQARRPFADRVHRDTGLLQTDAMTIDGRLDGSTAVIRSLPAVPSMIYPTANATDVVTTQAFEWTTVEDADAYILYIGTTAGANDVLATGC